MLWNPRHRVACSLEKMFRRDTFGGVSRWLESWRGLTLSEGLRRAHRLLGDVVAVSSVAMIVFLTFCLVLVAFLGERHWVLAISLYLPGLFWLLPMFLFLPFCLLFCARVSILWVCYGAAVVYFYMGFQIGEAPFSNEKPDLTIVSNNVGNNARTTVDAFAAGKDPDILLFQEAGPPRYYREKYAGLHWRSHGEFAVVAKRPILEAGHLENPRWGVDPIAARYVIELDSGKRVVIYNVHFPTRRFIMSGVKGKGMFAAVLGVSGGYGSLVRRQNRDFFDGQILLVQELIAQAQGEELPVILCGDFNVPGQGHLYRLLAGAFKDAHVASGSGFGFTFPGKTRNPLALFRPWLRIDHVFAGQGVIPLAMEVESDRPSQHRAVYVACRLMD